MGGSGQSNLPTVRIKMYLRSKYKITGAWRGDGAEDLYIDEVLGSDPQEAAGTQQQAGRLHPRTEGEEAQQRRSSGLENPWLLSYLEPASQSRTSGWGKMAPTHAKHAQAKEKRAQQKQRTVEVSRQPLNKAGSFPVKNPLMPWADTQPCIPSKVHRHQITCQGRTCAQYCDHYSSRKTSKPSHLT